MINEVQLTKNAQDYIANKNLFSKDLAKAKKIVEKDDSLGEQLKKKIIDILVEELGNWLQKFLHSLFG